MSPFEKLKLLRPGIKKDITLFPPYLLDKLVPIYLYLPFAQKLNYTSQILSSGENYVLAHYIPSVFPHYLNPN